MPRTHRLWLFSILSIVIVCFIFHNSLQNCTESNAVSMDVVSFVTPLLNPTGWFPVGIFHTIVRKLAHFSEFGALGICLTGASLNMSWSGKKQWIVPILLALLIAVVDENIQRVSGRVCSLKDILIDLGGALSGTGATALFIQVKMYRRKTEGDSPCQN